MNQKIDTIRVTNVLAENLENKANALIFWKTYCKTKEQEVNWLIAVTVDVIFLIIILILETLSIKKEDFLCFHSYKNINCLIIL